MNLDRKIILFEKDKNCARIAEARLVKMATKLTNRAKVTGLGLGLELGLGSALHVILMEHETQCHTIYVIQ